MPGPDLPGPDLRATVEPERPGPSRPSDLDPAVAARLKRDQHGLLAAVAQQWDTGEVLMVGWMDDEALHRTLTSGRCTYWSRSRREYWVKGETSGHQQWVRSVALDCDGDTVLVKVDQVGGACHTGDRTCFDAGALPAVVATAAAPAAPATPVASAAPAAPAGLAALAGAASTAAPQPASGGASYPASAAAPGSASTAGPAVAGEVEPPARTTAGAPDRVGAP